MNTISISGLCNHLIGQTVPTNMNGHAGRHIENMVEDLGIAINRGAGCDIKILGLELKSRDLGATSPQNVATMTPDEIVHTAYADSAVHDKFQQQLRVYTDRCVIVDAAVYDFSAICIQDLIERAYEQGRQQMQQWNLTDIQHWPGYVYGSPYGYWERLGPGTSYTFRINTGAFAKLEGMARSTFQDHYELE